jgi:hypothetical protein
LAYFTNPDGSLDSMDLPEFCWRKELDAGGSLCREGDIAFSAAILDRSVRAESPVESESPLPPPSLWIGSCGLTSTSMLLCLLRELSLGITFTSKGAVSMLSKVLASLHRRNFRGGETVLVEGLFTWAEEHWPPLELPLFFDSE